MFLKKSLSCYKTVILGPGISKLCSFSQMQLTSVYNRRVLLHICLIYFSGRTKVASQMYWLSLINFVTMFLSLSVLYRVDWPCSYWPVLFLLRSFVTTCESSNYLRCWLQNGQDWTWQWSLGKLSLRPTILKSPILFIFVKKGFYDTKSNHLSYLIQYGTHSKWPSLRKSTSSLRDKASDW